MYRALNPTLQREAVCVSATWCLCEVWGLGFPMMTCKTKGFLIISWLEFNTDRPVWLPTTTKPQTYQTRRNTHTHGTLLTQCKLCPNVFLLLLSTATITLKWRRPRCCRLEHHLSTKGKLLLSHFGVLLIVWWKRGSDFWRCDFALPLVAYSLHRHVRQNPYFQVVWTF